jgi:hypothetical protein
VAGLCVLRPGKQQHVIVFFFVEQPCLFQLGSFDIRRRDPRNGAICTDDDPVLEVRGVAEQWNLGDRVLLDTQKPNARRQW